MQESSFDVVNIIPQTEAFFTVTSDFPKFLLLVNGVDYLLLTDGASFLELAVG